MPRPVPCYYCGSIKYPRSKMMFECTSCHQIKHRNNMAWTGEQGMVLCSDCAFAEDHGEAPPIKKAAQPRVNGRFGKGSAPG